MLLISAESLSKADTIGERITLSSVCRRCPLHLKILIGGFYFSLHQTVPRTTVRSNEISPHNLFQQIYRNSMLIVFRSRTVLSASCFFRFIEILLSIKNDRRIKSQSRTQYLGLKKCQRKRHATSMTSAEIKVGWLSYS